jgi:hypothetical protein
VGTAADETGAEVLRALLARMDSLEAEVRRGRARLVTRTEAAEMLAMSLRHLQRAVLPHVRIVRSGRLRLVPVAELDRWIIANMDR